MNWKVRLKNPIVWLTVIPAIVTCLYSVLSAFGIVPAVEQEEMLNGANAIVTALAALGILVDPTTKGIGDSERAMSYEEPYYEHEDDDE